MKFQLIYRVWHPGPCIVGRSDCGVDVRESLFCRDYGLPPAASVEMRFHAGWEPPQRRKRREAGLAGVLVGGSATR